MDLPCAGFCRSLPLASASTLRLLSSVLNRTARGRETQKPSHLTLRQCPHPKSLQGRQLALRSEGVSSSRFLFLLKCEGLPVPRKAQGAGRVCVFRPPFGRRAHWLPETVLCTFSDPLTLFQLCSKLTSLLFLNSSYQLLSQDLCPRVPCYVMYGSHLASLWIHVNVTLLEIL